MSRNSYHHIKFGSKRIDFQLLFGSRKTLGIKVYPDCTVTVTAPNGADLDRILTKLKEKAPWIQKQQNEFLSYHPLTPPRKYVNGETHLYLGRQYRLKLQPARIDDVKVSRGKIVVYVRQGSAKRVLEKWYREKAGEYFSKVLRQQLPRFMDFKIKQPELLVRVMRTRWGSCTRTGQVILNPELIKAPKICIEYVVVHELCHLVHHNHTKKFYSLQQRMMPDWLKAKERLERALV